MPSETNAKRFTANLPPPTKLDFSDRREVQEKWKRFHRQWNNYAIASRLVEEPKEFQIAVFMTCIGDDALDILEGLPLSEGDRGDLSKIIDGLEQFCIGERSEVFESYNFHKRNQKAGESIDAYLTELRLLAKKCGFSDEDRMIRDRLVIGIQDDKTREKLLERKKLTLAETLEICRVQEQATTHMKEMSAAAARPDDSRVDRVLKPQFRPKKTTSQHMTQQHRSKTQNCTRCGRTHTGRKCPADGATCNVCQKKNHFAIVCRTKKSRVHALEEDNQDMDAFLGTISSLSDSPWKAKLNVNGKDIVFKIDTGADVTVIPKTQIPTGTELSMTSKRLFGPGHKEVSVMGKFTAKLQLMSGKACTQEVYILDGQKEPLLGRPAIQELELFERINLVSQSVPEPSEVSKPELEEEVTSVDYSSKVKKMYPELFTGLGKLQKEYKIELEDDARPFSVSTPRRIALPLEKKVEEELKKLTEQDIITEINSPTDWCAPMVVVPKPNGKIRICVDLTKLNESVKRENYPLPTTDNLLAKLSGATVFTKLDCNKGFHQIPLSLESQELTTFITPFGRFAYKRMPFGISSGPEIFHREMCHLLSGIPGVIVNIDDILISGQEQEGHDERLGQVLKRLKKAEITLNEKCLFSVQKVKFLGHIISKDGIQIDPGKLEAVTNFPQPQNVSDVRRLLGMANQLGKFIENLSSITEPLRQLLKKENSWIWTEVHKKAFDNIKTVLSTAPVLSHYDANRKTKVSSDASKSGLGAVLFQMDGENWKPVMFASRSMTSTEQRYAQIEKEALGITWACEKFSDYLIGLNTFQIETDHKPLVPLLQKRSLNDLPPRIQRFRMRLMRFSYSVFHTAGKDLHTADALSRAPCQKAQDKEIHEEDEVNSFVHALMQNLPTTKSRLEEIKLLQDKDEVFKLTKHFCKSEWPESKDENQTMKQLWYSSQLMKKFWAVRQELTVQHGILLYNSRLVIPESLQPDIMARLHEGHQGVVKCREMAKSSVWWPGLSTQIEDMIKKCPTCEKHRNVKPEPLKPSSTPSYPWQKVGMDLFDWNGLQYLLIVDYFSRWIEIALLKKTTSQSIVEHTKSIFARHGIPETVISDNGPQFVSSVFASFSEIYGFNHQTSSPRYPQGNGEAERAVQTVKGLLKKSADPYIALLNYRTAPLKQGSSPSELLMGRRLRSRIPVIESKLRPQWPNLQKFKLADKHQKDQQKCNFDKRHQTKPLSNLCNGQPVYVKTPVTHEAVVIEKYNHQEGRAEERSYLLKTPYGNQRRNRQHLRKRYPHQTIEEAQPPQETSLVPNQEEMSHQPHTQTEADDKDAYSSLRDGFGNTKSSLPRTVSKDTSPSLHHTRKESTTNNTYTTRSGREIKPPQKLTY